MNIEKNRAAWEAYAAQTEQTATYPGAGTPEGLAYVALGLCGESGEVCDIVKKVLRDDGGKWSEVKRDALKKELGDVCWYVSEALRCSPFDPMGVNVARELFDGADMNMGRMGPHRPGAIGGGELALHLFSASSEVASTWCRTASSDLGAFQPPRGALMYVLHFCSVFGFDFAEVLEINIEKLNSRKQRGVLGGSGDDR